MSRYVCHAVNNRPWALAEGLTLCGLHTEDVNISGTGRVTCKRCLAAVDKEQNYTPLTDIPQQRGTCDGICHRRRQVLAFLRPEDDRIIWLCGSCEVAREGV